jgi:hypothetical protein
MPFDIYHPSCIVKILLYASRRPHEPFQTYSHVDPAWHDACEPYASSAVILRLGVRKTPDAWLAHNSLRYFDATPLYAIQEIGPSFMAESKRLKFVDFSGSTFEQVFVINDFFLYHCTALERVDLSSLTSVMGIARGFLSGCTSLTEINLSFAVNVDEILGEFLTNTTSLQTIDVSPFAPQLEYIADNFLSNATSLREIRGLEKFEKIERIDYGLFKNCSKLVRLDVAFLKNLKVIPASFLQNCESLEVIENLHLLNQVEVIDKNFCSGCRSLKSIDFSGLAKKCKKIFPSGWLDHCVSLEVIDLTPFDRNLHVKNFFVLDAAKANKNKTKRLGAEEVSEYEENEEEIDEGIEIENFDKFFISLTGVVPALIEEGKTNGDDTSGAAATSTVASTTTETKSALKTLLIPIKFPHSSSITHFLTTKKDSVQKFKLN